MIAAAKDWAKRHWPRMRLRTILFATLILVAALPGVGAVALRVYENTLVRQTEAELVAQGAALAATAAALWPEGAQGRAGRPAAAGTASPYGIDFSATDIDLSTTPILPERPRPVRADNPATDAVAAATRLAPILADTRTATLASIVLLDRHGRIASGRARGSYAALPEVQAALAGRPATALRRNAAYRATYRFEWLSRAAAIRVHHARPIIVDGRVVGVLLLSRSARALFKGLYEDRGKILLGIVAILALLVVLSGVISRGVTLPIERLGLATRAVASGRGTVPEVPPTAAVEIQGLYVDFAAMAAAIDRRSRYLRDFAHAVSHEFKTPLAGIRGAIELLQDHPDMAPDDRRRFLANADADAGRLALLVTRLLELARADMAAPAAVVTQPRPVILQTAAAWRSAGFTIALDLPPDLPSVTVPAATIETALATLFENSRQAGATASSMRAEVIPEWLQLHVADNGPGVTPADRARLFEPFFTTKRADGGTGLGLSIARSLLEVAGATIEIADETGMTFVIALPLAGAPSALVTG